MYLFVVCVYVYVCTCVYVYICVFVHMVYYVSMCVYFYMYLCMCVMYVYIVCACVCICICLCVMYGLTPVIAQMEIRRKLEGCVVSHHVKPEDQIQVVRLGSKSSYLLKYLSHKPPVV